MDRFDRFLFFFLFPLNNIPLFDSIVTQVVLNSLHKYQPRIHIVRIDSQSNPLEPKLNDALCALKSCSDSFRRSMITSSSSTPTTTTTTRSDTTSPSLDEDSITNNTYYAQYQQQQQQQQQYHHHHQTQCHYSSSSLSMAANVINENYHQRTDGFVCDSHILSYTFGETQFIAVTAYQNEDVSFPMLYDFIKYFFSLLLLTIGNTIED